MVLEGIGPADIAADGLDRLVPAHIHHGEQAVPASAAEVRKPERRLWPASPVGSRPAASARRLTISATLRSDSAITDCLSPGRMPQNAGPAGISAPSSQAATAATGQNRSPRRMATS